MLFNSYVFIFLFLPAVVVVYHWLGRRRLSIAAKCFLVSSSLFFYAWWNPANLPVLLVSMAGNAALIALMHRAAEPVQKRLLLVLGLAFNLAGLGYYKYSGFLATNFNTLSGLNIPVPQATLPLAISFFTFQQIAMLVDTFGGLSPRYTLLQYCTFITFFPHLIAGPILHHSKVIPQFRSLRSLVFFPPNIARGLFLFSVGLFKKVVIADSLASVANAGFDQAIRLNLVEAWATALSYTAQIYFDFSGYTDMALGCALLFNIALPYNFDSPYKSANIRDFWRSWHITLGFFLRNYIYIPLGGNRAGLLRAAANLFFVFLVGGLWHGAGWTFLAWGLAHGTAMATQLLWERIVPLRSKILGWTLTFAFVHFTWVLFRAKTWADATKVLRGMAGADGIALPAWAANWTGALTWHGLRFGGVAEHILLGPTDILMLAAAFFIIFAARNSNTLLRGFRLTPRTACFSAFCFVISLMHMNNASDFLYFNF